MSVSARPPVVCYYPSLAIQVEKALPGLLKWWAEKPILRRYARLDVPESQRNNPANHPIGYILTSYVARWASVPNQSEGWEPESLLQRLAWSDVAAAAYAGVRGPTSLSGYPPWLLGTDTPSSICNSPEEVALRGGETWACWTEGSQSIQAATLAGWPDSIPLQWLDTVRDRLSSRVLDQNGIIFRNGGEVSGSPETVLSALQPGTVVLAPRDWLPDLRLLSQYGLVVYTFVTESGTRNQGIYALIIRATLHAMEVHRRETEDHDGLMLWGSNSALYAPSIRQAKDAADKGDRRLARRAAWFGAGCPLTEPVRTALGTPIIQHPPSPFPAPHASKVLSVRHDKGDAARIYPLDRGA